MTAILEATDLSVSYGPARALFSVSLSVPAGEAMALLGSNGAGKSTLGKALAGLVPSTDGRIEYSGQDITTTPAHRLNRMGICYLPEGRGIFPGLSVIDNLRMSLRRARAGRDLDECLSVSFDAFPILAQRRNQLARTLSGGEQQMLALCRVLAGEPRVVIADEPSLGLAPKLVDMVFENLSRALERGVTVLLIEQFAHRALAFAQTCVILQRGAVTWRGPASDAKAEVLTRYLGNEGFE
jgi:branched-chain amino acid transport system ATP-binding protein